MDSKLVVEQMSGRWKIKHPAMQPLAAEASRLAPFGTTYTWVPRERNKHADRLANEALDGTRSGVSVPGRARDEPESLIEEVEDPDTSPRSRGRAGDRPPARRPRWCWCATASPRTRSRSGSPAGLASANPGLSDEGRAQARAVADWLAPLAEHVDAVVASPVRRTRETAEIVAERLGKDGRRRAGLRRDGVRRLGRPHLRRGGPRSTRSRSRPGWARSTSPPPGGESFRQVEARVLAGLERLVEAARGRHRRRGQPRDPDQDPGGARGRRPAGGGLPDGAQPGVGVGACRSSPAARTASSRAPRCGSSTRCRRGRAPSASATAGRPPPESRCRRALATTSLAPGPGTGQRSWSSPPGTGHHGSWPAGRAFGRKRGARNRRALVERAGAGTSPPDRPLRRAARGRARRPGRRRGLAAAAPPRPVGRPPRPRARPTGRRHGVPGAAALPRRGRHGHQRARR